MKLLTLARDLKRRKARERQGLFVAEGVRTVEELLGSDLRIRGALVSPRLSETARGAALRDALLARRIEPAELSEAELDAAADTDSPQGVLAIAEVPERGLAGLPANGAMRLLVLDGVQDPGNVGTMLRTAAAFRTTATVALPGTVDLWNAKVVRSAMGAHFRHPALATTWDALGTFLDERGVTLWAADAGGVPLDAVDPPARLAVAVGNEGAGLGDVARGRASTIVALPIAPEIESLNVAVSAGIILYHLRQ